MCSKFFDIKKGSIGCFNAATRMSIVFNANMDTNNQERWLLDRSPFYKAIEILEKKSREHSHIFL